ncbi:MAG: exodeoxyribonuclease V subunit gamma [Chthoniobacteraceae bacterium]
MRGLKFYTSNQLETLAQSLAETVASLQGTALAGEVIVLQSRGMSRWVSQQIAQQTGICMNFEFPFPRAFVDRTLRVFFPEMADDVQFSADVLAWKIDALLPVLTKEREFSLVRNYLEGGDGLKVFQLAEKIAHLFDQYMVYRPEMILRWERGAAEREWQAILWRELAGKKPSMHLAAVSELIGKRMAAALSEAVIAELPGRVSIFGISSLPPLYMQVFFELARYCEVNLFSLHPSQEYYGQDLPPKVRAKMAARLAGRGIKISEEGLSSGNPLLTSLGRLNRDFVELQLETDERAGFVMEEQPERFVEPRGNSMLAVVQGDILHARCRGDAENPKMKVVPGDCSIQVHACHSPMREVEGLYDQLLDLFNSDPSLKPRDVIVMMPDIEKYAPFIQSVFAFPEERSRYIPHSVTDRRPRSDSPAVETFLSLLTLPGSRCTATEIFSLLDRAPVQARFKFTDDDMALMRRWIVETGIRWGVDAKHRAEFGLPKMDANTWRAGFRRLLLGFAMTGNDRTMWEGMMPYEGVEGSDAETLGRFITAVEAMFAVVEELPRARTLAEWAEALGEVAETFFLAETPQEAGELRLIQGALDKMREVARVSGEKREVEFRAVRHYLTQLLGDTEQRGGFLTGGVTFCALKPMRSIPARVICLIGMDDQAFPRQPVAPGFDLMAKERRCGDRSVRDDDRYSFLEAIVSARECLYVSYLGHSAIDNKEVPPSVVVSELMDYLGEAFEFPEGRSARKFVMREHRLHAFSAQYFDGKHPGLFSYSEAGMAASRGLVRVGKGWISLPPERLPEPGVEMREVELGGLIQFFANPCKYLVRKRLGINLDLDEGMLEDSEPFVLEGLGKYQLKQELVTGALEKYSATVEQFAARGVLPQGELGAAHFNTVSRAATAFSKRLMPELRGEEPGDPLAVDLQLGVFSLTGRIESIYGERVVHFRCATLKPKDRLRAWISHLARCAVQPGVAHEMVLVGEDEGVKFSRVANAAELLGGLLEIYWQGLMQSAPFFPEISHAYADGVVNPSTRARTSPMQKARNAWNGGDSWGAVEKDAYEEFCFGGSDPIDEEFARLAMAVFEPMLRNGAPLP